jgi:hypothetical protein
MSSEEIMIEDNPNQPGEGFKPRPPLPPTAQKAVYAGVVLLLMAASFMTGRYSAQMKSPASNPYSQLPPTPMPLGTPVPIPETALTMIDFTGVSEAKKAQVLANFNTELCQCNCKMTVAQCMVRDPGCPFWKDHVTQFQKALGNGRKPRLTMAPRPGMIMAPGSPNRLVLPSGNPNGFSPPPANP